MVGRMKINTFTVRVSLDRAPCEERPAKLPVAKALAFLKADFLYFLIPAIRVFLGALRPALRRGAPPAAWRAAGAPRRAWRRGGRGER